VWLVGIAGAKFTGYVEPFATGGECAFLIALSEQQAVELVQAHGEIALPTPMARVGGR
jgi:hypothetical protein